MTDDERFLKRQDEYAFTNGLALITDAFSCPMCNTHGMVSGNVYVFRQRWKINLPGIDRDLMPCVDKIYHTYTAAVEAFNDAVDRQPYIKAATDQIMPFLRTAGLHKDIYDEIALELVGPSDPPATEDE